MSDVQFFEIAPDEEGQRLDNYLLRCLRGVPRSHIYRIVRGGEVRVNKKRAKPMTRLHAGDSIRIPPVRVASRDGVFVGESLSKRLEAAIVYEDNHFLVLNKPAGIAVHGGSGLSYGVIEALRVVRGPGEYLELVHRLDRETSGCLLVAKRRSTLKALQGLLADRDVQKTYLAILTGRWEGPPVRKVEVPLEKQTRCNGERHVTATASGKPSCTVFRLLENFGASCLVEASPVTGRTHQIRVHAAFIGHPLAGDSRYGTPIPDAGMQGLRQLCLHAARIRFTLLGNPFVFEADFDHHFAMVLENLRKGSIGIHG